jgi:hypothetical protein
MNQIGIGYFIAIILAAAVTTSTRAHDHFAIGVADTNTNGHGDPDEPLAFIGASGIEHVFHLLPRPEGFRPLIRCGGFYSLDEQARTLYPLDAFSIVALSNGDSDDVHPLHAMNGSSIWVEIVSVAGPPGAQFGFWDQARSQNHDTPTVSFATNEPTGNYAFIISEGPDLAGEDPFGHIHARAWTADQPGNYAVGLRLVDRSTNRPGGGSWHSPSAIYYFRFAAGPRFQPVATASGSSVVLTWQSQMGIFDANPQHVGITFTVERSTGAASSAWSAIGLVIGTTTTEISFTDTTPPPVQTALYRLKYDWAND